jgi:uncharacterized protein (TIGR00159 family)
MCESPTEGSMGLFEDIYRSFRLADAFDIAFVAVFIYTALTWFKETTSRYVFVGVGVLTMIYFAARAFDMYMTVFFFQAVFAVLLVALVVVFQEDLRRAFERLATFGTVRERLRPAAQSGEIDALVEAAADLAENRIGALVVLKGEEPLDRHVRGGVPTDARISRPLLDSIFDPHSMGHDGAVIIEHGRIKQFAAHLPLSKNLQELGARGTRHAAALGLSECSDALCIVVSEERGRICVAERGKLMPIAAAADLKDRMVRFSDKHFPSRSQPFWTRLIRENARLKVASLAIACVAWMLMVYEAEKIQQTFNVPIEYRNQPADLVLDDAAPAQAKITLSGYQRAFNLFDSSELGFSVDMSKLAEGDNRVELVATQIRGTNALDIERISPRTISVVMYRPKAVRLIVELVTTGRVPPPAELAAINVNPATIEATLIDPNALSSDRVQTEPIDLAQITESTTVKARLRLPEQVRLPDGAASSVEVRIEVRRPPGTDANGASQPSDL